MRIRQFLFVVACCIRVICSAQEVCSNGVDDDADGLVDLNDTLDCACAPGIVQGASLVPNAFLEDTLCCPTAHNQLACCDHWFRPTTGTSDYFNTCGFFPDWIPPLPDGGAGCIGGFVTQDFKEYVGTCLNQPLQPDTGYALTFHVVAFLADHSSGIGFTEPIDFGSIELTLYGSGTCPGTPLDTYGCPVPFGWTELGSVLYEPTGIWQPIMLSFTPDEPIVALMLGSPCELLENYPNADDGFLSPYFIYDAFAVQVPLPGTSLITSSGTLCNQDLTLVCGAQDAISKQWYRDGVALVGQVGDTLPVSQLGLAEGTYQFTALLDTGCVTQSSVVLPSVYPAPEISAQFNLLLCGPPGPYQWYLDGEPIPNADNHFFVPAVNGDYTVTVTNASGCVGTSEPYPIISLGVQAYDTEGLTLLHVPGSADLIVHGARQPFTFELFDQSGKCLASTTGSGEVWRFSIDHMSSGLYLARLDGRAVRLIH